MAPLDPALQGARFDASGRSSPRATRSQSISSDRPSMTGYGGMLSPPPSVEPSPAFIAASAASQIVTNDHDSQSDTWFDQRGLESSGETALVTPAALKLVNTFLDQLLFNFLSTSRSTSLASLRPAVSEVLKPKLAKDAINGADQELHEYLGGGEDEDLMAFHNGLEPSGDWDQELVWKRTRLRCMVYSSLGDMEEEDEDFYTEQEQLDGPPGSNNPFSNDPGVVSPAVAIFLTSILEFMGEQALVIAGHATYHRLRAKHEKAERDGTSTSADISERVVVEESDMERVALDRTLGRLWRGWKKRIRSPTTSMSMTRSFSRESAHSQPRVSQAASIAPEEPTEEDLRRPSLATVIAEHEHAASIPPPMSVDNIRGIEIPRLTAQSDVEEGDTATETEDIRPPRPKSLVFFPHKEQDLPTPSSLHPHTSVFLAPRSRMRSNSLPSPAPSPYTSPSKRPKPSIEAAADGQDSTAKQADAKMIEAGGHHIAQAEESAIESPEDIDNKSIKEAGEHKGLIFGVIAGANAVDAATVASITAITNGEAPRTNLTAKDHVNTEEEFVEEPQIMTSSRVSIGGRISPDDTKALSIQSSVRPHSVHSLRLIDVALPKSPNRSRHGSVDGSDYVSAGRNVTLSRTNSMHSPILAELHTPRGTSPIQRDSTASPLLYNGSAMSTRHGGNSAGKSISKVEENNFYGPDSEPMTAIPSDLAAAMQGVDVGPYSRSSSEPISEETKPQTSTFTLSAPPKARTTQESNNVVNVHQPVQPDATILAGSKALGVENGALPLTPPREIMEGALDTSDEASLITPSCEARSVSEHPITGHSPNNSSPTLSYTKRPTDTSRTADQQRSIRGASAVTYRSSPPRAARENSIPKPLPEPLSKTHRILHTSSSGSSSASNKLKPIRTSEDSAPSASEDKGQSFEQLIRSDQTIQYTLTPQSMRNIENPDSPRRAAPAVLPSTYTNGHDAQRPGTSRSQSSSVSRFTGLQSNPPAETSEPAKSVKLFKPVPRPSSNTGARLRSGAPQARDARVDRDSIGDFAEFIRSTGPPGSYDDMPPRSTPAVNGHHGVNGTARNVSGSAPRVGSTPALPRRAESSAGRSRLQAREAVVPFGDGSSDLIDFIRQGPPRDKTNDNPRIPRTVAPFRTTMDSDQMSGAVGGKAVDAQLSDARYSQASTNVSNEQQSMQSIHSSINSQSALLNNPYKTNKPLPGQNRKDFDEDDIMPKRKTRRVRDPYAIDFGDEEDEYEATPKPNPIQEESLADFLRNVPPPTTTSVFESVPKPSNKDVKKKGSAPSLMSRFSRNISSAPQAPSKLQSNGHDSRSSTSRSATGTPQLPSHTPIAAKYSTGSQSAAYQPARGGNYVSQLNSARNPTTRVQQKTYQPREATQATSQTNDLADFLRNSEPPPNMIQPQIFTPAMQREEEPGGFTRMFGRKKKVAGY